MNYTCAQLCVNSGTRYLLTKLPSWQTALTHCGIVAPLNCTENSYNQETFLSRCYFNLKKQPKHQDLAQRDLYNKK